MRHPLTHVRTGRYRTRTARPRRRRGNKHPSGVFVSARFSTHRNVYRDDYRFVVDGTGLKQQRRRPPPAAETGSRGWGRVLIFQGPAKGLKKNQQTQPVRRHEVTQAISPVGCCLARDGQRPGMSTRKEQRQGNHHGGGALPFAMRLTILRVSGQSLRTCVHGRYARTQEKGKAPAYRG